jgi:DNA-binding LacI/PurR family transcriptional regulator
LCGNDDVAFGVLRALHDAGRVVPDDMSVVGFDDTPVSEFAIPALTTVRLDFAALGRACFGLLRDRMDDPTAMRVGPAPVLVHRESCGPPPARRATRARRAAR